MLHFPTSACFSFTQVKEANPINVCIFRNKGIVPCKNYNTESSSGYKQVFINLIKTRFLYSMISQASEVNK